MKILITIQLVLLVVVFLNLPFNHGKVVLKSLSQIKTMLRGTSDEPKSTTTYISIMEGSKDVYATCEPICKQRGKETLYTEFTIFPGYGSIFRCQCGENWSSWYNWADMTELCTDIMLGDTLFNDYINLLGYDTSDCQCDALKNLLGKLIK